MHLQCSICSDVISEGNNCHSTKCGHIFHCECILQWIERSKTCPQCRNKVTASSLSKVYPTYFSENTNVDAETLMSKLDDANLKLRELAIKVREADDELEKLRQTLKIKESILKSHEQKLTNRESAISGLKKQVEYLMVQNTETERLKAENESLHKNIQLLNGLQKVLNATNHEVKEMLEGYTDVSTVATFAVALKRALTDSEIKKNDLRNRYGSLRDEMRKEKEMNAELRAKFNQCQDKLNSVTSKHSALRKQNQRLEKIVNNDVIVIEGEEETNEAASRVLSENNIKTRLDSTINNVESMINKIESSESPYLSLKQSSLALTMLQRKLKPSLDKIKPSELMMLRDINSASTSRDKEFGANTIFKKKELMQFDVKEESTEYDANVSYDGLGGHSKLDRFPERNERPLKSCVPKLTAKHKLKRPSNPGNQDISKMFKKSKGN